jgi:hypothetical protein
VSDTALSVGIAGMTRHPRQAASAIPGSKIWEKFSDPPA